MTTINTGRKIYTHPKGEGLHSTHVKAQKSTLTLRYRIIEIKFISFTDVKLLVSYRSDCCNISQTDTDFSLLDWY